VRFIKKGGVQFFQLKIQFVSKNRRSVRGEERQREGLWGSILLGENAGESRDQKTPKQEPLSRGMSLAGGKGGLGSQKGDQ